MPDHPLVVLMGVAGCGKSTVGPRVAARLGVPFVDGDDVHSETARSRMAAGVPLDDAERGPWLDRLHTILVDHAASGIVLACSALKAGYRKQLAGGRHDIRFVALVAPPAVLAARLAARTDHFAGPELLPSQLESLELGPDVTVVDSAGPLDAVTEAVTTAAGSTGRS
ncbi:MAG TPA: gluconokinase [Acidimicrobiia bacterium]|jgi:gluconokinase